MTTSSPSTPASASLSSGPTREGDAADDGLSIAFSDVGYRHRWGNWALHNITHTFRPGTITGLLGRNGSGKSTLLDLAAEMRRPTRGSVSASRLNAVEDSAARSSICLLGTRRGLLERAPVKDSLALWEATRPHWNRQDAEQYLDCSRFGEECAGTPVSGTAISARCSLRSGVPLPSPASGRDSTGYGCSGEANVLERSARSLRAGSPHNHYLFSRG